MRVLFIYPNLRAQIGFNYGLAFISAVLKEHGHMTRVLNINERLGYDMDFERIRHDIEDFAPDLIGISVVTNQYKYAAEIAGYIKSFSPVPLLCGGIHPTMAPEEVLNEGVFDFVCVGEGELATLELIEKLEQGKDMHSVRNIWSRREGDTVRNPVRPFVTMEELPRKDYGAFEFQKMIDAKNGWVGLMTSRGCPYCCSYCLNHKIIQIYERDCGLPVRSLNYVRHHPVGEMMDEISFLLENYSRIKMFIFDDDLFTFDEDYLVTFCREYRRRFTVPFVCNAHPKRFTPAMASELKQAGCQIVKFGVESGSDRIRREVMKRHMTNSEIRRAFDIAHREGLHTSAFLMVGLPYETEEDVLETVRLLADIKPGRFRWSLFFPYINTDAYEICSKEGIIDWEKMEKLDNFTEESCLRFEPEHTLFIKKMQRLFPWYVNAYADVSASDTYRHLVDDLSLFSAAQWDEARRDFVQFDSMISDYFTKRSMEHYRIRYNEFMAVKTDWVEDV